MNSKIISHNNFVPTNFWKRKKGQTFDVNKYNWNLSDDLLKTITNLLYVHMKIHTLSAVLIYLQNNAFRFVFECSIYTFVQKMTKKHILER